MKKNYILDTNAIFEDLGECIEILRNGSENNIFIPKTVLDELDKLKNSPTKRQLVSKIVDNLIKYKDHFEILNTGNYNLSPDNKILDEIKSLKNNNLEYTFITNDKMFRLKALKENINTEEYKTSIPYKSESEKYTGFVDLYTEDGKREDFYDFPNSFHFDEKGRLQFYSGKRNEIEFVSDNIEIWNLKPWDAYQAAYMKLLIDNIDVISVNGNAGTGKSLCAGATALYLTFQEKKYKKIYVTTSNVESSENDLGYRPGMLSEKFDPLIRHMKRIFIKLHNIRNCNKLFIDPKLPEHLIEFNPKYIEFIPLSFMRGETYTNCVILLDECQNLNKHELKTILSRCGENVKFISTGCEHQIDNPKLNINNNGLNWMVKCFQGDKNFGHITLNGKRARGPICEMTNKYFN